MLISQKWLKEHDMCGMSVQDLPHLAAYFWHLEPFHPCDPTWHQLSSTLLQHGATVPNHSKPCHGKKNRCSQMEARRLAALALKPHQSVLKLEKSRLTTVRSADEMCLVPKISSRFCFVFFGFLVPYG